MQHRANDKAIRPFLYLHYIQVEKLLSFCLIIYFCLYLPREKSAGMYKLHSLHYNKVGLSINIWQPFFIRGYKEHRRKKIYDENVG